MHSLKMLGILPWPHLEQNLIILFHSLPTTSLSCNSLLEHFGGVLISVLNFFFPSVISFVVQITYFVSTSEREVWDHLWFLDWDCLPISLLLFKFLFSGSSNFTTETLKWLIAHLVSVGWDAQNWCKFSNFSCIWLEQLNFSSLTLFFCLPHRPSKILAKQVVGLLPILSLCSKEAFIFQHQKLGQKTWPKKLNVLSKCLKIPSDLAAPSSLIALLSSGVDKLFFPKKDNTCLVILIATNWT